MGYLPLGIVLLSECLRDLNLEVNHGKAVYGIRNLLRYGINAKHCMKSSRRKIHLR